MATGISYKVTPGVGSIKIEIKATSSAILDVEKFEFFCRLDVLGATATSVKTVNSVYTFDGLKNGTRYAVNVKIFYKDGSEEFLGTESVYTLTNVKISEIATGDTYCVVQLINLDTNYGANDRTVYWTFQADGDAKVKEIGPFALNSNISKSDKYTIDGLDPGIDYTVCAVIYYNGGSVVLDTVTISTQAADDKVLVSLDDTIITIENYNSKHIYKLYRYASKTDAEDKTENHDSNTIYSSYDLKKQLYNNAGETIYYRVYNQSIEVYSDVIKYDFPGWIEDFSITVGGTLLKINDYDQDSYDYTCCFYSSDIEAKNNIMIPDMGTATMDRQTFDLTELVFSPEEYEQLKNTTFWVRVYRKPKTGGLVTYSNVGKFTFGVESVGAIVVEEIGGKYVKVSLLGCSLGQGSKRTVQWMMRPTESNKEYKQYGISNNVAGVITLIGLEENTSYYIVAVVSEENGNQLGTAGPITVTTTKSAKADIEVVESGTTLYGISAYLTLRLINLSVEYAGTVRRAYWRLENLYTGDISDGEYFVDLENGKLTSDTRKIEGLDKGTPYRISAYVYNMDTHLYENNEPLSVIGPKTVTTAVSHQLTGVDYTVTSGSRSITIEVTGIKNVDAVKSIEYSYGAENSTSFIETYTSDKKPLDLSWTFSYGDIRPDTVYRVRVIITTLDNTYNLGVKYIKTKLEHNIKIEVNCSDYTSANVRLRNMNTLSGVDTSFCGIVWEIYSNNSYQKIWQEKCYPESQQVNWDNSIPLNITGLTKNTTYTVYAQLIEDLNGNSKKDSGEYSESFGPVTFITMSDEGCGWATIRVMESTLNEIRCGCYMEYADWMGHQSGEIEWQIKEFSANSWHTLNTDSLGSWSNHPFSITLDENTYTDYQSKMIRGKKYLLRAYIRDDPEEGEYNPNNYTNAIEVMLPHPFEWVNKISGQPFDLTKEEWDALTAYIDSVYINKKGSSYGFTEIAQGDTFTYNIYNDAFDAIAELGGNLTDGNTRYTRAYKNKPITAGCLNILAKAIKEIQ